MSLISATTRPSVSVNKNDMSVTRALRTAVNADLGWRSEWKSTVTCSCNTVQTDSDGVWCCRKADSDVQITTVFISNKTDGNKSDHVAAPNLNQS